MIGQWGVIQAVVLMLSDKTPGIVAAMNERWDGSYVLVTPALVAADARPAFQLTELPSIEVIPQRLMGMRLQDSEYDGDWYRCTYDVRVRVSTDAQRNYEATTRRRMELLTAVRQTILRFPSVGLYIGEEKQAVEIEATSITELMGPLGEQNGHWYGEGSMSFAVITLEKLDVPVLAGPPITVFVSVDVDVTVFP